MTNGLVLLIAWSVFALLIAALVWIVLRRTNDDPIKEIHTGSIRVEPTGDSDTHR
jgi:predicted metal-binding membrane protein